MLDKGLKILFKKIPENNRWERIWKLAQIDFRRRYFNTRLGLLWAFINPVFRLFIYLFVFTWLGRMRMEGFGFYIFSALILWMSFSEASSKGISLFQSKAYLIKNIEFNKIDLFISSTISVFLGLIFNVITFIVISLIWGNKIYLEILYLPILLSIHFVLCLGVSMILAVSNIYFRDIKHLWAMIIMLGFWTLPAIFPLENFTGNLKLLLFLNPVAGILINFRNALMYGEPLDFTFFLFSLTYSIAILLAGTFLIKRHWQKAFELN